MASVLTKLHILQRNNYVCFLFQLKLYASWSDANPRIDNTYRGGAYNLDTLNRTLYTDVNFLNVEHPTMLYCFQFLFPFLTAILIAIYVISSHLKDISKNINTISTTAAHAVLSFMFILFVLILDICAVTVGNETPPEYYNDTYHELLFVYPGLLLFWDILGLCTFVALVISALIAAWHHNENTFPLLVEVRIVPLLCFASHAHYILIAWITDPFYATSVGIYYGICYIIHLLLFKRIFKDVYYLTNNRNCKRSFKDHTNNYCCKRIFKRVYYLTNNRYCGARCVRSHPFICSFGTATGVFFIAFIYQVLLTVFVAFIPINNAIENVPSKLFIALQSAGALLLGFLAYQTILGKESLSMIIGAVRRVIKMQPTFYTGSTKWKKLENEEKFAEVLQHVFKINVGKQPLPV